MINNLELLRFSYEEEVFKRIESTLGTVPQDDHVEHQLLNMRREDLLGDAVRITEDLLPEIHEAYNHCLSIIGGDLEGELFIRQSKEYNASVFAHGNQFDILINSALLNDFNLYELKFVFGHEIGHVIFGHSWYLRNIINTDKGQLSPDAKNLLFRWSRASEISADRAGLLCSGQLEHAVKALFQTSSGLIGIDVDRVLRSFRKQYDMLESHIKGKIESHGWFRTHPMMPIRFKALELVALDIIAFRNQSAFSSKGFKTIDRQIAYIIDSLDAFMAPNSKFLRRW
ncbi:MAG: M48 family metallopeptidase [Desulfobacterales bacterium]|nr:M48 family metallopeptidase [Desulfobacterales bacterium]